MPGPQKGHQKRHHHQNRMGFNMSQFIHYKDFQPINLDKVYTISPPLLNSAVSLGTWLICFYESVNDYVEIGDHPSSAWAFDSEEKAKGIYHALLKIFSQDIEKTMDVEKRNRETMERGARVLHAQIEAKQTLP